MDTRSTRRLLALMDNTPPEWYELAQLYFYSLRSPLLTKKLSPERWNEAEKLAKTEFLEHMQKVCRPEFRRTLEEKFGLLEELRKKSKSKNSV